MAAEMYKNMEQQDNSGAAEEDRDIWITMIHLESGDRRQVKYTKEEQISCANH